MTPREKQKTQWGMCFCAQSTPLLGQQQTPSQSVPGSTHNGPGLYSWRHKATLIQRAFNHSQPRWWVTRPRTPNEAALLWDSCQLFVLLLPKLFLRLKQRWKGLRSHCTATEGVRSFFKPSQIHDIMQGHTVMGEEMVTVHTTVSHGMSRKIYV
jgi:hypothetical protein